MGKSRGEGEGEVGEREVGELSCGIADCLDKFNTTPKNIA